MLYRAITRALNTRPGLILTRILLKPEGVFLCYPVEERFADHFASRRRQKKNSWQPWLIGFMWQEQSSSIVFAISASETELRAASTHNLVSLVAQIEDLQRSLGASRIAMAGILPSLLRARRLRHSGIEFEITCRAVASAIEKIVSKVFHVAGLPGRMLPRMPGEYKDAIPCCAAKPGGVSDVIVKRIILDGI